VGEIRLAQLLWGDGFLWPGGEDHIVDLIEPLHLRRGDLVVDLAAGLGGPARVMAKTRGAWVTGLERDSELARRGMLLSEAAGLGQRAPILSASVGDVELETGAFDAVFARFATYDVEEKERLLRVAIGALNPTGRLLLVDFVQVGEAEPGWAGFGETKATLWSRDQYSDCLTGLGAAPEFVVDLGEVYRTMLRVGLKRVKGSLLDIGEVELTGASDHVAGWADLASALETQTIGVACFFTMLSQ